MGVSLVVECGGRADLEDAQIILELADKGIALVRVVFWLHLNGPVKAFQAFPCDACIASVSLYK